MSVPRGFGEQGNNAIYFRGTSLKLKVTGEQGQFWGTGNIEIKILILGDKGKCHFFFRGIRLMVPPPPWEGLIYATSCNGPSLYGRVCSGSVYHGSSLLWAELSSYRFSEDMGSQKF